MKNIKTKQVTQASHNKYSSEDIDYKNGMYYYNSSLFTGKIYDFFESNRVKRETSVVKGKKHGRVISWYYNGSMMRLSHYQEGILDGKEIAWDSDGKIIGQLLYKNNKPMEGNMITFTYYNEDQNFINGFKSDAYKSGIRDGKSIIYRDSIHEDFSGINLLEGIFKKGKKSGHWIEYYRNGCKKAASYYLDDIIQKKIFFDNRGRIMGELIYNSGCPYNGSEAIWDEQNGILNKGSYKNGEKHGLWFSWSKGFCNWEGYYKNGKKHGKWIKRKSKNEILSIHSYKEGMKHGKWTNYSQRKFSWEEKRNFLKSWRRRIPSFKQSILHYKNDKLEGTFRLYNDEGALIETGSFWDDILIGKYTKYYADIFEPEINFSLISHIIGLLIPSKPNKSVQVRYDKRGLFDGKAKRWYRNGNIKEKSYYLNGKKEGKRYFWNEDGDLIKTEFWKDSNLVKTIYHSKESNPQLAVNSQQL